MESTEDVRVEASTHRTAWKQRRKPKVAPAATETRVVDDDDDDEIVYSTLQRYATDENATTHRRHRRQSNHVDRLYDQFVAQPTQVAGPMRTAMALEMVAKAMRRVTEVSSSVADIVMQTLVEAIYCDYDPAKDLVENTRFADKDIPAIPRPTRRKDAVVLDIQAMAQQWNDLVLQNHAVDTRSSSSSSSSPSSPNPATTTTLTACLDVLPPLIQSELASLLRHRFPSSPNDERGESTAPLDRIPHDPCDDDGDPPPDGLPPLKTTTFDIPAYDHLAFDPHEGTYHNQAHPLEDLVTELVSIYRLLSTDGHVLRRRALHRLHVLLLSTFGLDDDAVGDTIDGDELDAIRCRLDATDARALVDAGLT
ncbi:Aste57867_20254 [Aphanomyces stellatus]|uniref:Aste57867_20254 protein n=1 Tax=Aphanomyces stellatus TaxID=120398 RepID=A0A485LJ95_9STRA|nr:hypothetical protein As57867_020188 [Aphanomyces stellatus]VFT96944.1 Aste57867_20254 [Aphanomyces stellatus]